MDRVDLLKDLLVDLKFDQPEYSHGECDSFSSELGLYHVGIYIFRIRRCQRTRFSASPGYETFRGTRLALRN